MRQLLLIAVLLSATIAHSSGQKGTIAPGQNHLFLLADDTARLQMALDQAGSSGLHVVFSSDQGIFLTRGAAGDAPGAYRPVADDRPEDFEKALNAGGEQGFRVIPATLTRSRNDTVVIMRRAPAGSTSYRYRVVASDSAFERTVGDLASKGFSSVGVFTQQSGMAAALGRPGRLHLVLEALVGGGTPQNVPAPTGGQVRVVSTTRAPTMEREINDAAGNGYRIKGGSFMNVVVEKGDPTAKYTYRVIGAIRGTTLTDEIQKAGLEGYRVVPSAVMHNPASKLETVVVMEHSSTGPRSYEYAFVSPSEKEDVHAILDGLLVKGFVPVGLLMHGSYVIILEKGA